MLGRFTHEARRLVTMAREEAHALDHCYVGTEHLVLALLKEDFGVATQLLRNRGVTHESFLRSVVDTTGMGPPGRWGERDAEALRLLGIELSEIRRKAEEAFGRGALDSKPRSRRRFRGRLRFTRRVKKALERSLYEARDLGHDYLAPEHILLATLQDRDAMVTPLLGRAGIEPGDLRAQLIRELRRAS